MLKFSANLGFLWSDLALPEAIIEAKRAGFHAVECHWPYSYGTQDVKAALKDTGFDMICLNTVKGGDNLFGLTTIPGFERDARAAIDQAIDYAADIGALNIHVMAGCLDRTHGNFDAAKQCFCANLAYGTQKAASHNINLLIEPINHFDVPDYFLTRIDQAIEIINELKTSNLKLMFDCYHAARMNENVIEKLTHTMSNIGHIQFASVPDRGPPNFSNKDFSDPDFSNPEFSNKDNQELNFTSLFRAIERLNYNSPLGAEYIPKNNDVLASLKWLHSVVTHLG